MYYNNKIYILIYKILKLKMEVYTMKKGFIIASVLTIGISSIGIAGVAKADVSSINGDSENVDNYNGLTQSKTQENNSGLSLHSIKQGEKTGGYWIRGTKNKKVISHYKHYYKQGIGTAINGKGVSKSGGWKKAGTYSKGEVKKTLSSNKAFYDHK